MTHVDETDAPPSWLELAFVSYLRLLGLCMLALAAFYWLRVTGIFVDEFPRGGDIQNWRFDTMSTAWKTASAILSVLLPIAAVGLWSTLSWGQVVWTMAIATELFMYTWLTGYFGTNPAIVAFHISTIGIYLAFRAALHYNTKKA